MPLWFDAWLQLNLPNPSVGTRMNDQALAAAISGYADLIVSGDDDLLSLGSYRGIEIVTARDALTILEDSQI